MPDWDAMMDAAVGAKPRGSGAGPTHRDRNYAMKSREAADEAASRVRALKRRGVLIAVRDGAAPDAPRPPAGEAFALVVRIPLGQHDAPKRAVCATVGAKPKVSEAITPLGVWALRWDLPQKSEAKAAATRVRALKVPGIEIDVYDAAELGA